MSTETAIGPAEAAYWELRPDDAPDPAGDAGEAYLLTYARMLDMGQEASRHGRRALIAEWQLAVVGPLDPAADRLRSLMRPEPGFALWSLVADEQASRVSARALVVGTDRDELSDRIGAFTARCRAEGDRPGARIRPPRVVDASR